MSVEIMLFRNLETVLVIHDVLELPGLMLKLCLEIMKMCQ